MNKAQALKRKINLEVPKGITHNSCKLSSQNLNDLASKIGLEIGSSMTSKGSCVDDIIDENAKRSENFIADCSLINCPKKTILNPVSHRVTRSKAAQGPSKVTVGNSSTPGDSVADHTTEGGVVIIDIESNSSDLDLNTPVKSRVEDSKHNQLADLIEEAWTKVVSTKKNKKKRK